MTRTFFFALWLCGAVAVSGAELIRNNGFEDANPWPWIFWPVPQKLSAESPASGKQCLELVQHEKSQLVAQRPLAVRGGMAYRLGFRVRGEKWQGTFTASCIFSDAEKKTVATQQLLRFVPGEQWRLQEAVAIAPENAVSAELQFVGDAGNGKLFLDDVSLTEGSRVLGTFGDYSLRLEKETLTVSGGAFGLSFDWKRNGVLTGMTSGGRDVLSNAFLVLAPENGKSVYELYAPNLLRNFSVEPGDGSTVLCWEEMWGNDIAVRRSLELFDGASYFKLGYDVEAGREFRVARVMLNLGFPETIAVIACRPGNDVVYRKWAKPEWFNLPRSDKARFLAYSDAADSCGVALIGADAANWQELPGNLLSSAGKNGGFSLELNKWVKRDLRSGDKVSFLLFVAATGKNGAATAEDLLRKLTGN